mmetsp:Transcript_43786/g.107500  ORF Transcript_43786/g.107500 Transcript_43786/m.107500 type:complete len:299 (+) Transcript_43786:581-1477(+)
MRMLSTILRCTSACVASRYSAHAVVLAVVSWPASSSAIVSSSTAAAPMSPRRSACSSACSIDCGLPTYASPSPAVAAAADAVSSSWWSTAASARRTSRTAPRNTPMALRSGAFDCSHCGFSVRLMISFRITSLADKYFSFSESAAAAAAALASVSAMKLLKLVAKPARPMMSNVMRVRSACTSTVAALPSPPPAHKRRHLATSLLSISSMITSAYAFMKRSANSGEMRRRWPRHSSFVGRPSSDCGMATSKPDGRGRFCSALCVISHLMSLGRVRRNARRLNRVVCTVPPYCLYRSAR